MKSRRQGGQIIKSYCQGSQIMKSLSLGFFVYPMRVQGSDARHLDGRKTASATDRINGGEPDVCHLEGGRA